MIRIQVDTGALFATTAARAEEARRRKHPKYVADVIINSQMLQAIPYIVGHTLLGFYPVVPGHQLTDCQSKNLIHLQTVGERFSAFLAVVQSTWPLRIWNNHSRLDHTTDHSSDQGSLRSPSSTTRKLQCTMPSTHLLRANHQRCQHHQGHPKSC